MPFRVTLDNSGACTLKLGAIYPRGWVLDNTGASSLRVNGGGTALEGLQSFWPTADASAVDLDDYSGNGLTLTNNNIVTRDAGPSANLPDASVYASASSQSLSVADDPAFTPGASGFSVAIWARITTKSGLRTFIAQRGTNQNAFELAHNNTGDRIRFALWNAAQSAQVLNADTLGSPDLLTWFHNVGTWDGVTMRIYINGALDSSAARTAAIHDSTADLQLGAGAGANFHNGRLTHAAIWPTRALSAAEVAWLYNGGNGRDLRRGV
ncbi:MAG: hypothetical protein GEU71_14770 [Actinobacteria bacterium]|nr:hypothetical protein [Actinomycetota bacterium]